MEYSQLHVDPKQTYPGRKLNSRPPALEVAGCRLLADPCFNGAKENLMLVIGEDRTVQSEAPNP